MDKIKLVQCYHCYAIADHKKSTCPYFYEPQKCPKCSQSGHKSWECKNRVTCLHCNGPHPVTAPCCPIYQAKLKEIKSDLLKDLLNTNTYRSQNSPNQNDSDALNMLITSALTANGSLIAFVNSLFLASQALAQASNPISSYPP